MEKDFVTRPNPVTVAVDFDGVIHRYSKGWHDGSIYDPPMPGADRALEHLFYAGCKIIIYSTRLTDRLVDGVHKPSQIAQVMSWWTSHGLCKQVEFWTELGKPLAHVYIDDRAVHFKDWTSTLEEVHERYPALLNPPPKTIVVPTPPQDGIARLLRHLGLDPNSDGLKDTPDRVVKAFEEMTVGYKEDPAKILERQFDVPHDEMVVLSNIEFVSLCEHHLLPFAGTATVGYIPGQRVVGISKLARLVECFARRLQVQERMTQEIAKALELHLQCVGCGVVVDASHSCMSCRGVKQARTVMQTSVLLGAFREDAKTRAEFLSLARRNHG